MPEDDQREWVVDCSTFAMRLSEDVHPSVYLLSASEGPARSEIDADIRTIVR